MKYEIEHRNHEARCAWCWHAIAGGVEPHTVVKTVSPPHMELHFHHQCWQEYRAVSGAELEAKGASWKGWTPERIEALRLWVHQDQRAFAQELGIGLDRFIRIMRGKERLNAGVIYSLRRLATRSAFERVGKGIDWTDRRAGFCLRMHLQMSQREMATKTGTNKITVAAWERRGVPRRSLKKWGVLNRLAAKHKFDAGMIVDDRAWTQEFLNQAFAKSGKSQAAWAQAAGCSRIRFHQWLHGATRISRDGCWLLTKAATLFNVPLPDPTPEEAPTVRNRMRWTLPELLKLGTAPDSVVAEELGRGASNVKTMRILLDIPVVKKSKWSGERVPCPLTPEQLERRWNDVKKALRQKNTVRARQAEIEEAEAQERLE